MDFMGKKLEDIVVTLPFADGTELECGVYSFFEVNNKKYFALLPLKGEKELDFPKHHLLYVYITYLTVVLRNTVPQSHIHNHFQYTK